MGTTRWWHDSRPQTPSGTPEPIPGRARTPSRGIATRCGETRSGVVERLIREAEMPRPRTVPA